MCETAGVFGLTRLGAKVGFMGLSKILGPVLLLVFMFSSVSFSEPGYLTVCTYPAAPYTIDDGKGHLTGLEIDLANALVTKAGFRANFTLYPWNRALEMLKYGKLDILMTMSKTREREAFTYFLGVSTFQRYALFVRSENSGIAINSLDDFTKEGCLFGIHQNFFYSAEFNDRLKTDPNFKRHFIAVSRIDTNLKSVKAGGLTGCIGDSLLAGYMVRNESRFKGITMVRLPFFKTDPVYFGVSRKINPTTLEKLKKAYDDLDKSGELKKIIMRWEGRDGHPKHTAARRSRTFS